MARPAAKKLVCPKRVRVGSRTFKVSSRDGQCHVKRADGTRSSVNKVARGHKGFGTFAKRKQAKAKAVAFECPRGCVRAAAPPVRWDADAAWSQ